MEVQYLDVCVGLLACFQHAFMAQEVSTDFSRFGPMLNIWTLCQFSKWKAVCEMLYKTSVFKLRLN